VTKIYEKSNTFLQFTSNSNCKITEQLEEFIFNFSTNKQA